MVSKDHEFSIARQCKLLNVPRSSFYYQPAPIPAKDLELMRLIDACHLEHPYYGSRRIKDWLADKHGLVVARKRVTRLMRRMGIVPIYPKRNTSRPNKAHETYPYLLRGLDIERPNQVWCTDLCYIPMARGFLYLVAIMDWHSRKVLAWRLSNTMDTHFCLEALDEAIARFGVPEIFNTDQGAQFTSRAWTDRLKEHGIRISMDGKGRCLDNVFIERLWRSLKYEEVYLKAYDTVAEAKAGIGTWMRFYNTRRRHQGLANQIPDSVYFSGLNMPLAA